MANKNSGILVRIGHGDRLEILSGGKAASAGLMPTDVLLWPGESVVVQIRNDAGTPTVRLKEVSP